MSDRPASRRTVPLRVRLRQALKPPRRLRILRPGALLIGGTLALGLATLNTGNNLLYLLMGALLGFIALSGWLSENTLQRLTVVRRLPRGMMAGQTTPVSYVVRNGKKRLPSCCIEIREAGRQGEAFLAIVEAGEEAVARGSLMFERRGIYTLERLTVATSFPFGLFAKERDLVVPGAVVVWPDTATPVRAPRRLGLVHAQAMEGRVATRGSDRAHFRGLRPYRSGDDPRDVHWRSSARLTEPVVREYDRDAGESYWLVLDTGASGFGTGEAAVNVAAAIAARSVDRGDRFGFSCVDGRIPPGTGGGHLEAVLDVLARVRMSPVGTVELPADPAECILVTERGSGAGYGDVYTVREASSAAR